MGEIIAYHVVTDKPMQLGQHIIFDDDVIIRTKLEKPSKYKGLALI